MTKLLRQPEVLAKTGLSASTLWQQVSEGRFPAPIKITGSRMSAWVEDEIDDVIAAAIKRRDKAAAA